MSGTKLEDEASMTLVPGEEEIAEYTDLIHRSRDERRTVAELLAEAARTRLSAQSARERAAELRARLRDKSEE